MNIKLKNTKGAGNDFIIIDNRLLIYDFIPPIVRQFYDRIFEIGADRLMLLETCKGYDFRRRYFNSDGGESNMCGNGGRCIATYAQKLGLFETNTHFCVRWRS